MILEDQERLEGENRELRAFREQFYDASLKVAVLEADRKRSIAWELLSTGCVALGSAAIGVAPSVWSSKPSGWVALILGATVLLIGIFSRYFRL